MKISISVKKLSVKSLILTISLSISSDTLWRDNSEFFKLYLLRKFKKYLIKEQDISHGCGQYAQRILIAIELFYSINSIHSNSYNI